MEKRILRKRRRLPLILSGLALLLAACSLLFVGGSLRPALLAIAEAKVRADVARIMNDAVFASMDAEETQAEWVTVHEGGDGVYLLETNTRELNLFASRTAERIHARIAVLGEQGITVPAGTVSGVDLFAGKGPDISVSFQPVGSVIGSFRSDFTDAGINQTKHSLYLDVKVMMTAALPLERVSVELTTQFLVCETIFVGEVPQTVLQVDFGDSVDKFFGATD